MYIIFYISYMSRSRSMILVYFIFLVRGQLRMNKGRRSRTLRAQISDLSIPSYWLGYVYFRFLVSGLRSMVLLSTSGVCFFSFFFLHVYIWSWIRVEFSNFSICYSVIKLIVSLYQIIRVNNQLEKHCAYVIHKIIFDRHQEG